MKTKIGIGIGSGIVRITKREKLIKSLYTRDNFYTYII